MRDTAIMTAMRFRQAIVTALSDEMESDERVILFGEDVAAAEGVFKTSEGLLDKFGPVRVRDTPISEMAFTGAAVGAAMMGMRPVIEIMFMEFLGVALDQLVTEGAKMHYLSKGEYTVPMVVRASCGAGLGFGTQHSQTLENWVAATPGLKVIEPSDAQSATHFFARLYKMKIRLCSLNHAFFTQSVVKSILHSRWKLVKHVCFKRVAM